jgi:hypothetical protein
VTVAFFILKGALALAMVGAWCALLVAIFGDRP